MRKIMFKVLYLKPVVAVVSAMLGLLLVCGSLYYVNLKTVHPAGYRQTLNWSLTGTRVAVDPGHGGYDPGAKGPGGTLEKELNLAIALKLKTALEQAGAEVIMTREQDVDLLYPGEGTKKYRDLSKRLDIIREGQAELLISIHMNSSGSRWRGAQVFYYPDNADNKKLAEAIQEEIRSRLQNTTRNALSLNSSYLLKEAKVPAVIVEAGFITNPAEEKLLNTPEYQQQFALAVVAGIARFLSE